ncbi:hypothetical protein M0R72_21490, partial [Candidatus Pacearchaeota archaeon]|nr:hypothetical protein [Candidatus Pacearchaeota archaeon]
MNDLTDIEKTDAQRDAEALAEHAAIVAERMTARGFKRDVAGPDFDAVINRLSIAELGKRCVIFSGGSGRGKTFAMMCA